MTCGRVAGEQAATPEDQFYSWVWKSAASTILSPRLPYTMLARNARQPTRSLLTSFSKRQSLMSTYTKLQRPSNWKEHAPEAVAGSLTYKAQSTLPKLPVPKLEDTLVRLKETLKPIAWTEEEFTTASKRIDEFAQGKGPELHQRLLKHAEGRPHWLEQWWDDGAYLGYRDSVRHYTILQAHSLTNPQVVVNVSYYCM